VINHVRTLLMNAESAVAHAVSTPGEEYIPATFQPVTLPSPLLHVRQLLFGVAPDRLMLNWRMAEFTSLLAYPELAPLVVAKDARLTYADCPTTMARFTTGITVTPLESVESPQDLCFVHGSPEHNTHGQLLARWQTVIADDAVTVTANFGATRTLSYSLAWEAGLSNPVPLHGSNLSVQFAEIAPARWTIQSVTPPAHGLGQVLAALQQRMVADTDVALFHTNDLTRSLRAFWGRDDLQLRLGAVLLALADRTDAYRQREGV
jgi:hypothetical protein